MKKIANNVLNTILIVVLSAVLVPGTIIMSGCKGGDIKTEEAAAAESGSDAGEMTEAGEADEDSNGEEPGGDDSGTAEETADEKEQTGEEQAPQEDIEEAGETEEVPAEITEGIELADKDFDEGLYAEAAQGYRDATRVINDADISQGAKDELLAKISQNHQDAEYITETARMHHSNAMTLQYEKRFEEAKIELEAALEIYPKYQTAVDALDSLEALMGLE